MQCTSKLGTIFLKLEAGAEWKRTSTCAVTQCLEHIFARWSAQRWSTQCPYARTDTYISSPCERTWQVFIDHIARERGTKRRSPGYATTYEQKANQRSYKECKLAGHFEASTTANAAHH